MTAELARTITAIFLSVSEDEINIIDWAFKNKELKIKLENHEDGLVEVYTFAMQANGFAISQDIGNFDTVHVETALNNIHEQEPVCSLIDEYGKRYGLPQHGPSPTEHSVACLENQEKTAFEKLIDDRI